MKCGVSGDPNILRMTRHSMTTAGQTMTVQYHGNAVHASTRMPLDEGELAQVQWAGSLVAQNRRDSSVYTVRT
jgi:hypothetical protein